MRRREDGIGDLAGPAGGSGRGVSAPGRRASKVRLPFEALESRVLLSTSPALGEAPSIRFAIPVASYFLVAQHPVSEAVAEASSDFALRTRALGTETTGGETTGSESGGATPLLDPASPGPVEAAAAPGPLMTLMSDTSGDVESQPTAAIVVVMTPGEVSGQAIGPISSLPGASGGGGGWTSVADSGETTSGDLSGSSTTTGTTGGVGTSFGPIPGVATSQSGSGGAGLTTSGASSSTSWVGDPIDLPDAKHVELEDDFYASHTFQTVQIPLDGNTRELGLSLQGMATGGNGPGPIFGQIVLVDAQGDIVQDLGPPIDGPGGGPISSMTLSLRDIPAGGSLLVQISMPSGDLPLSTSAATGGGAGIASLLPYLMDVQRVEGAAANSGTGAGLGVGSSVAPPGRPVFSALPGSSSALGSSSSSSEPVDNEPSADPTVAGVVDPGEDSSPGDGAMVADSSPAQVDTRIATGPLASRGATPVGPNLSSESSEPTPAIDRHELGLSQEIAAVDSDEAGAARDPASSPETIVAPDPPGSGLDREGSGPFDASTIAIAGMGPLPMRVVGDREGDRPGAFDALHAAMMQPAGPGEDSAELAGDGPLLVSMATPDSGGRDRRPVPDFLTSACILALGMGLITGPVIPDLLRLFPARSWRWRPLRGMGPGLTSPDQRRFGPWSRRRLGS